MARSPLLSARVLTLVTSTALVAGLLSIAAPPPLVTKAAAAGPGDAQPGELVDRRTRTSLTTRQNDGMLRTTVSAGAVHYRDSGGAWKRIESDLVDTTEAGYASRR